MHADRSNRLLLALAGLLVLAAGGAGMAASTGVFGADFARRTLLDNGPVLGQAAGGRAAQHRSAQPSQGIGIEIPV